MKSTSEFKNARWLVTGGCGFIGTSLIGYLLEHHLTGHIRVLDNMSIGTRDDLRAVCGFEEIDISLRQSGDQDPVEAGNKVELIAGDIRSPELAIEACRGMDIIVHLAANTGVGPSVRNPRKDMEHNVMGTFNLLEGAWRHNVGKFIFASSGAPVGEVSPPIHEEIAPKPVSPYGASKLAGEGYCSAFYRTYGLKTVSLRFGNVYGPGSIHKDSVVARFIKQALTGDTLEVFGDGQQTRDYIYVKDLLEAIVSAASADIGGEVFQIATQKETSVNDLIAELQTVLKRQKPELEVTVQHGSPRQGDVRYNYSDTSKAVNLLGWSNARSLKEGLEETVRWFIDHQR
jgi:UDP-glucose 4-epimerase